MEKDIRKLTSEMRVSHLTKHSANRIIEFTGASDNRFFDVFKRHRESGDSFAVFLLKKPELGRKSYDEISSYIFGSLGGIYECKSQMDNSTSIIDDILYGPKPTKKATVKNEALNKIKMLEVEIASLKNLVKSL